MATKKQFNYEFTLWLETISSVELVERLSLKDKDAENEIDNLLKLYLVDFREDLNKIMSYAMNDLSDSITLDEVILIIQKLRTLFPIVYVMAR